MESLNSRCYKTYLGQEDGVDIRVMLEPLQHAHPLNLACATMDVRFSEFLGIRLKCLRGHNRDVEKSYLERIYVVRKDNDFVSSRLMEFDKELARLEFFRIHTVK